MLAAPQEQADAPVLVIRPVSYRDVLAHPLLVEAHYEELATHKELMELHPDEASYRIMDEKGVLFALGVFDGPDMVGYSVNIVHSALHYSRLTICENDVVFLAKDYRSAGNGRRLLAATRQAGHERGAKLMIWHAKPETSLHALLAREGAFLQDLIFSEAL